MTEEEVEALKASQREVQRCMGRCVLRLQMYEQLIKAVVAHQEVSGPIRDLDSIRAKRVKTAATMTFGSLVNEFLGASLVSESSNERPEPDEVRSDALPSVTMRIGLTLSKKEFARARRDLKSLVRLRNDLVHHFIDKNDLQSLDGCHGAQKALVLAHDRIDQALVRLRDWATDIDKVRQEFMALLGTEEFRAEMNRQFAESITKG
jgi:hypothetical protein